VRILLDENLPLDLAAELPGHETSSVAQLGWQGLKNSELLRRAQGRFDALLTMDTGLQFQQNIAGSDIAILLLVARSNRMVHLRPLAPAILTVLKTVRPGELRKVGV
jgi:hypothetical protein